MNVYVTTLAAALLLAGAARASDEQPQTQAGEATRERARVQDGTATAPDAEQERARAGAPASAADEPLRERARERMREALAEHAPGVPPSMDATGPAAREWSRERERAREEMANRMAERHAKRVGASEAGERREREHGSGPHGQGGMGMDRDECGDAQRRMTEQRERMGGMDGPMMDGGGTQSGPMGGR